MVPVEWHFIGGVGGHITALHELSEGATICVMQTARQLTDEWLTN